MTKGRVAMMLVLAILMIGSLLPMAGVSGGTPATLAHAPPVLRAPSVVAPRPSEGARTSDSSGTPRTVLIETFTAEWCEYCEEESQAMYLVEHAFNRSVVDVAEIHVCYSESVCGDNYQAVDGTAGTRMTYYGVDAFPDVFFDGGHNILGAICALSCLYSDYSSEVNNSSAIPGNVSIAQSAEISSADNVTVNALVTPSISGTFNAISYLLEFIGKNDSTHHDIENVVRRSVIDSTVTLTAGDAIALSGTVPIASTWNESRLSVITFLQQNSTAIIENSNMVPVTTLAATVGSDPSSIDSSGSTQVTVTVTNGTTGNPLVGASVNLSSSAGGSFTPASGATGATGTFSATYKAPSVTSLVTAPIEAAVSAEGYIGGAIYGSVTINPVTPPGVPTGLAFVPALQSVLLTWNAPSSGGGGLTYHVYRSTSPTGGFVQIGTTATTTFNDTEAIADLSYWYTVAAANPGGFSANSSVLSATAVTATASGLPLGVGWWLQIDAALLTSATNGALAFHLPGGLSTYSYGADAYAYVSATSSGGFTVTAGLPGQNLVANFTPRYAILQGSVTPTNANVTVNGQPVSVVNGAFSDQLVAGAYAVKVSSTGYTTNSSTVFLTPGNISKVTVSLVRVVSSGGVITTSGSGGFSGAEMAALVSGVAIGAAIIVGILLVLRRRGGPSSGP